MHLTFASLSPLATHQGGTKYVLPNPLSCVLGLAAVGCLLGLGCYLAARGRMTWVHPCHAATQATIKPSKISLGLEDKNRVLRDRILNTKIPDFQSDDMQARMIDALMEASVAHCMFEKIFLGGQEADLVDQQTGACLEIKYLVSASIYFNNKRILAKKLHRHIIGRNSADPSNADVSRDDVCNVNNLNNAFLVIDQARREDSTVLIHCQQGKDRSATVMAAYLVSRCQVSAEQAYGFIRSRRVIADTADPYINWVASNQDILKALDS